MEIRKEGGTFTVESSELFFRGLVLSSLVCGAGELVATSSMGDGKGLRSGTSWMYCIVYFSMRWERDRQTDD